MAVELISQIWQLFCIGHPDGESTSIVVRVLALASSVVDAAA
jgi:hypothetical protein